MTLLELGSIQSVTHSSKKQFNLRLPIALIEALKATADAKGVTVTDFVIHVLEQKVLSSEEPPSSSSNPLSNFDTSTLDRSLIQPTLEQVVITLNALVQRVEQLEARSHPNLVPGTTPPSNIVTSKPELIASSRVNQSAHLTNSSLNQNTTASPSSSNLVPNNDTDVIPWL